jgi:hypothetical protein
MMGSGHLYNWRFEVLVDTRTNRMGAHHRSFRTPPHKPRGWWAWAGSSSRTAGPFPFVVEVRTAVIGGRDRNVGLEGANMEDLWMTNRIQSSGERSIRDHYLKKRDPGVAVEEERSNIGRGGHWQMVRFGVILSSVNGRLMFTFDETILASNMSHSKVILALHMRVFRKKHKAHPLHSLCGFHPLWTWTAPGARFPLRWTHLRCACRALLRLVAWLSGPHRRGTECQPLYAFAAAPRCGPGEAFQGRLLHYRAFPDG